MKTLTLNGEACQSAAESVEGLVQDLELVPETLLIEHNGTALHRSEWTETTLQEGDALEILRVSAGG